MGAGKGKTKRVKLTAASEKTATIDILMNLEEKYCPIGRALRDKKFTNAVPTVDDIAELSEDPRFSASRFSSLADLGPVEQAELILMHKEYDAVEVEYAKHLIDCAKCQEASSLQEVVLSQATFPKKNIK